MDLNVIESRVLGCLIEKALSTPEYYPLSINAVVNACNQKSNRHPVMTVAEPQAFAAIKSLLGKQLARTQHPSGSRVEKYAHTLSGRLTETLNFDKKELTLVAELLLRGPQTPGELRSRTSRMYEFDSLESVLETLERLHTRGDGPFVEELPREPGRREARFRELFSAATAAESSPPRQRSDPTPPSPADSDLADRLTALEIRVAELESLLRNSGERGD